MSSRDTPSQTSIVPELLAISFSYPPLAAPRSVQVARLLKHLCASTVLVCAAEDPIARKDTTIEPDAEARLRACLRVAFPASRWRNLANRVASRARLPLWNKRPDEYSRWKSRAVRSAKEFARANDYRPDIIATFAQPMTDHLIGLELKRFFNVPWIAHFSDPWTDNPFHRHDALTASVNRALERRVIESADKIIFTSQETVELVMRKYPAAWKAKASAQPQGFDPALYPARLKRDELSLIIRYTGELYGRRTPRPLALALRALMERDASILRDVTFEIVGDVDPRILADSGIEQLPAGLLTIKPPVTYRESLALVAQADGLLVIDAPATKSVFLPSKLIDYVGAARPILGLTPPGAASALICELGGWVADPTDTEAMAKALEAFLAHLRRDKNDSDQLWGDASVRRRYETASVVSKFEGVMRELLD